MGTGCVEPSWAWGGHADPTCTHSVCGNRCHSARDLHLGWLHSNVLVHTSPHCTCNIPCRDVLLIHIPAPCAIIFPQRQAPRQIWEWKCKAEWKLRPAGATTRGERRAVYPRSSATCRTSKDSCNPFGALSSPCLNMLGNQTLWNFHEPV